MYVREKVIRRGKKEYRYFQLVQSTWVEGKSRQTVVQHLGPFATHKAATGHAKQAGYLCGAVGCYETPTALLDAYMSRIGPVKVFYCDEHALQFNSGNSSRTYPYDPEKAAADREIIRRTGRGGRPPFQLQDRDSAMKTTSWD